MPTNIENNMYYSAAEVTLKIGISRQTLWRWRREKKVPPGLRYRKTWILFTRKDLENIEHYANHLEPVDQAG